MFLRGLNLEPQSVKFSMKCHIHLPEKARLLSEDGVGGF